MKVSVYKGQEGELSVLVQASPGKGMTPVVVQGITLENIQEEVGKVVAAMRLPKPANPL